MGGGGVEGDVAAEEPAVSQTPPLVVMSEIKNSRGWEDLSRPPETFRADPFTCASMKHACSTT